MGTPRVIVVEDDRELGRRGADVVAGVLAAIPAAWVAVATGRSPLGMYAELADRRRTGLVDASAITAVQLDEYLGVAPDDGPSLFGWMRRSFLEPLGVDADRVVKLPLDGDIEAGCAAFDRTIAGHGGLDLAILGLGMNGHLGFNEPPADADAPTRVVRLSSTTLDDNAHYWGAGDRVPETAVTVGLRQLLDARRVLLVVSGTGKHAILRRALEGPVGSDVPASFLQRAGADVIVIADRTAWEGEGDTDSR